MRHIAPIRFAVIACVAISASLQSQVPRAPQSTPSTPAQASSTLPSASPATTAPPEVPLTPSQRPPKRAQITYEGGLLSISADNASLNQILRQIATTTGMKITGGVADERVFGTYGPADPAQILASLLDGTGSNMILAHRDAAAPAELILTPRQGGPTPPNPNAAAFNDRSEPEEAPRQAVQPPPITAPPPPQSNPGIPPVTPGASTGTSPSNSTPSENPNGVKTPQQIYEQLQRLRQQQQQQPTPPQ